MGGVIEDMFFEGVYRLGLSVAFMVAIGLGGLTWAGVEAVRNSQWGIPLRVIVCIPLTLLGVVSSSAFIGLSFSELPELGFLGKMLVEGPIMSIVFFSAMPKHGGILVLPFLGTWLLFQCYIVFLAISDEGEVAQRFGTWEGFVATVAICSALLTYSTLWKSSRKEDLQIAEQ